MCFARARYRAHAKCCARAFLSLFSRRAVFGRKQVCCAWWRRTEGRYIKSWTFNVTISKMVSLMCFICKEKHLICQHFETSYLTSHKNFYVCGFQTRAQNGGQPDCTMVNDRRHRKRNISTVQRLKQFVVICHLNLKISFLRWKKQFIMSQKGILLIGWASNNRQKVKYFRSPLFWRLLRSRSRADLSVGVASLFPVESAPSSRRGADPHRKRSDRGPTEVPGPWSWSHASLDAFSYIFKRLRPTNSSRIRRKQVSQKCVILVSFGTQSDTKPQREGPSKIVGRNVKL